MSKDITLRIRYHEETGVIQVLNEKGIFVGREKIKEIISDLERFYRHMSDREIDIYIQATTERWKERKSRTGEKPGYIYLFESYDGFIKIGQSKRPEKRVKEMNTPYRPKMIHKIQTSNMDTCERYLHKKVAHCRCDGEWFLLSAEELSWLMHKNVLDVEQTSFMEYFPVTEEAQRR